MKYTDKYQELANAIVIQAVNDYRNSQDDDELEEIEEFILSDWFRVLTKVNPYYLLHELYLEKYGK